MFKTLTYTAIAIAASATLASADLSYVSDFSADQLHGDQIDLGAPYAESLTTLIFKKTDPNALTSQKKLIPSFEASWTWAQPA